MATPDRRDESATRDLIWRLTDGVGLEHCRLTANETGPVLTGTVVTLAEGEPCSITYWVQCDRHWHTREVLVDAVLGSLREPLALHLLADGDGEWVRRAQSNDSVTLEPLPQFAGCIDIDLGFTPATNTLPIRRLQLALTAKADVTAVWVQFPSFELTQLPQRYTRIASKRYLYESMLHGFNAILDVDELGLIERYQDLWERVTATAEQPSDGAAREGGQGGR